MADAVSCLALQRPLDVVVRLVDSAVQSRGHIDCVVGLLRRLPSLARITTDDGHCALLDRLDQQIVSSTQQTLQNITSFCRLLLVNTYISSCPALFDRTSAKEFVLFFLLVNVRTCLRVCVN